MKTEVFSKNTQWRCLHPTVNVKQSLTSSSGLLETICMVICLVTYGRQPVVAVRGLCAVLDDNDDSTDRESLLRLAPDL
jgi:hypothetical protein